MRWLDSHGKGRRHISKSSQKFIQRKLLQNDFEDFLALSAKKSLDISSLSRSVMRGSILTVFCCLFWKIPVKSLINIQNLQFVTFLDVIEARCSSYVILRVGQNSEFHNLDKLNLTAVWWQLNFRIHQAPMELKITKNHLFVQCQPRYVRVFQQVILFPNCTPLTFLKLLPCSPCALRPAPCVLRHTPCALRPAPYALRPASCVIGIVKNKTFSFCKSIIVRVFCDFF